MLEKSNYRVNRQIGLPKEIINGQACGQVSKFRLGFFPFGYCGCEMIALYNATLLLGGNPDLAKITKDCYKRCVFFWGIFGSHPIASGAISKTTTSATKRTENMTISGQESKTEESESYHSGTQKIPLKGFIQSAFRKLTAKSVFTTARTIEQRLRITTNPRISSRRARSIS